MFDSHLVAIESDAEQEFILNHIHKLNIATGKNKNKAKNPV